MHKKTLIYTVFLLLTFALNAQITKIPNKNTVKLTKPILNKPIVLPTYFEEIYNNMGQNVCYKVALTGMQAENRYPDPRYYDLRMTTGIGFLEKVGKAIEAKVQVKHEMFAPGKETAILRIAPKPIRRDQTVWLSIRFKGKLETFYGKLKKAKNKTYLLEVHRDQSNESAMFTICIYRTPCLI